MYMEKILRSINNDRFYYYGIAIVFVVFYHLQVSYEYMFLLPFNYGYIGVDIFLFFSGYGLCYSYHKKSLNEFYLSRIKRILPVYLLYALGKTFLYQFIMGEVTLWDWFCNLTTLSYYGLGGFFIDWYLTTLLVLYIAFPLFYAYINKTKWIGWGGVILVVGYFIYRYEMDWQYAHIISRLPIFTLGILLYVYLKKLSCFYGVLMVCFLAVVFGIVLGLYPYYIGALFCPFVILALYYIKVFLGKRICYEWVNFCGRKSVEIYVANAAVMISLTKIICNPIGIFFAYFLLNVLFSVGVILFNFKVQKILEKF